MITAFSVSEAVAGERDDQEGYRFKLITADRIVVSGIGGSFQGNRFVGTIAGDRVAFELSEIHALYRDNGTSLKRGALTGLFVGLLVTGLLAINEYRNTKGDPWNWFDTNDILVKSGLAVAGGTMLGVAVGNSIHRWETVVEPTGYWGSQPDGDVFVGLTLNF